MIGRFCNFPIFALFLQKWGYYDSNCFKKPGMVHQYVGALG